ncbi:MAG: class I SAM-dependent methyltransferase [Deltaproteobacteria bacterium]|nr:class I SAM-dependent methyltransferase [Deltaproteobacteria bacterium]
MRDACLHGAIAGYPATLAEVRSSTSAIRVYVVADLERLVDRAALLRGDAEPPYWAYLWTGSRCLAEYVARWVDLRGQRVLDIGCGLGLAGLVAAQRGGDVVFVDGALPALSFVRASLHLNGLAAVTVCADYRRLAADARFDCILAAEVAYEPETYDHLAATLARHLAPGGTAFIADGFRTDTRALYCALAAHGLTTRSLELRAAEEGRPARIRLTEAKPRQSAQDAS